MESYLIRHVCASEATARVRFEEVRKKLLEDIERSKVRATKRGKEKGFSEDYGNFDDDRIALVRDITFDDLNPDGRHSVNETPFWEKHKLEQ